MSDSSLQVFTVSQITEEISGILSEEFDSVAVEGEISGWKVAASGHAYFSLRDETSLLKAVMWRSRLSRAEVTPADGQLVRAFGSLTVYPPRGEYQLDVRKFTQAGVGLLQQKFEELKRNLEAEGLFDPGRKRRPPFRLRRVVVITSPTGAALRDFLRVLDFDGTPVEVLILPVRVQGVEAPSEIADALGKAASLNCDLVVLTRGGGSLEDLWAFNEEVVARAIATCPVPVVSGVGHEVDVTIADFVADIRVATPTAAAQFIVERVQAVFEPLQDLTERLEFSMREFLRDKRADLENQRHRLETRSPLSVVPYHRQRVDDFVLRAGRALQHQVAGIRSQVAVHRRDLFSRFGLVLMDKRGEVRSLSDRLSALDPKATLNRGYTLCETARDSRPVRSVKDVPEDENVRVHLSDGNFEATPVLSPPK
jgi:exodeoxyribonuclease VII large subunit